jgi:hypothetical protein
MVYDDAFETVKKYFPEKVKEGSLPSLRIEWNLEKMERVFGFRFRSF